MLTHIDESGKARMVDVSSKASTPRVAYGGGWVYVGDKILSLVKMNEIEKGDVLSTSKIAGILAAKRVGDLIPLCHPLNLSFVDLKFQLDEFLQRIYVFSEARIEAKTGVEMEALTAVSIAALTIYDMCKGVDKGIFIGEIYLVRKTGGKSGEFRNFDKIKGVVKSNKDGRIVVNGILPEHLKVGDVLVVNDRREVRVVGIEEEIIVSEKNLVKEEDRVCLKR